MSEHPKSPDSFFSPRHIVIGEGKVMWDEYQMAWALPGCRYTRFRHEAEEAARLIDRLIRDAGRFVRAN